jgi:hypothetical protein
MPALAVLAATGSNGAALTDTTAAHWWTDVRIAGPQLRILPVNVGERHEHPAWLVRNVRFRRHQLRRLVVLAE